MEHVNNIVLGALRDAVAKCHRCEGSGLDKMRTREVAWGEDKGKITTPECLRCKPQRDALATFELYLSVRP
jgi:hypothetical protein